MHLNKAG